MMKRFVLIFFCVIFGIGNAMGDEINQEEAFGLGDIVVTSQKVGIADIGISNVITVDEIKAANAKTVADVMKFVPGVVVTRGRKNEPEISIHGYAQEKSQFLIDGIPYYETNYGKLSLDQVPVSIIARIEITKNAPSVLYGPNAQIAVINVITKKGTETPTFQLNAEMGENRTYRASASHGNTVGNLNYWFSYIHEESDGWRLSSDFKPEIAYPAKGWMEDRIGVHENGGFRSNSDYKKDRLWARVGLETDSGAEYFLSCHLLNSELGHPPATDVYRIFLRDVDDPGFSTFSRYDKYDDYGIDFSMKKPLSDTNTVRAKLFYHNHEDLYISYDGPDYSTVVSASTYEDDLIGASVIDDFSLIDSHEGHVSFHYKMDSHNAQDDTYLPYNQYRSFTGSIGTEHSYYFDKGLTIYGGIAYDWFEMDKVHEFQLDGGNNYIGMADGEIPSTQEEINPMGGITWDFEQFDTTVFASVAKKTQFPTLHQMYSSDGNEELESEKSINYTLGVSKNFGSKYSIEFSGFYHDISDWISRDYDTDEYMNVEEVRMMGIETSAKAKFCDYFSMNLNYTYNDAENKTSDAASDKVNGVPEQKLGIGFNVLIPRVLVSIDLQGIYVDEMYDGDDTSDDYFIVNSRFSKIFKDQYELYAEVDNIMDEDYYEEVGFPAYGRNIRAGLHLNF